MAYDLPEEALPSYLDTLPDPPSEMTPVPMDDHQHRTYLFLIDF